MTSMTGTAEEMNAIIRPYPKLQSPIFKRLQWAAVIYFYKVIASCLFLFQRRFRRTHLASKPAFVKCYPCRPTLENRIYFPPDYSTNGKLLPLYLNIHGGGFVFGDPSQDDDYCASWAKRTGMLVVSINYRKAPSHPFPTPTYDVAAICNAVLDDETLPIDHTRVAIGGFSAGGNLALSAAQLPGLKGTIRAAVVYYPVVDFGKSPSEKLDTRPYKSGLKDRWGEAGWWIDWGYVRVGQNRHDSLLSPCYAEKGNLPRWIYIVGAQWDVFRLEAQDMIHALAGLEDREDQEAPFENNTYKWTMATGCLHGFTHYKGQDLVKQMKTEQRCEEFYGQAHEWLKRSVLSD